MERNDTMRLQPLCPPTDGQREPQSFAQRMLVFEGANVAEVESIHVIPDPSAEGHELPISGTRIFAEKTGPQRHETRRSIPVFCPQTRDELSKLVLEE